MLKTRGTVKKLTVIGVIILILWLLFAMSSLFVLPKSSSSSRNLIDIEKRIDRLEKQIEEELTDSGKLLLSVKEKLKNMPQQREQEDNQLVKVGARGIPAKSLHCLLKDLGLPRSAIGTFMERVFKMALTGSYSIWLSREGSEHSAEISSPIIPVLVIACDRVTVKRCIENLILHRPDKDTFPIIVSQDCGHNETYEVIRYFVDKDPSITVVRQPDLDDIPLPKNMVKFKGYYKIARHFKFALSYVLSKLAHEAVIVVEDDLDISPDFFQYFLGTYPLLHKDPSIWCISAWNDNGKKGLIDSSHPELLHRTDFFPGLGWMMTRESWNNLEPKWPQAFFDDWLRDPQNTNNRSCIRPEISRTYSFGKVGVSKGLFFDMHLRYIQLNMKAVDFTKLNLSYLLKHNYDRDLQNKLQSLSVLTAEEVRALPLTNHEESIKVVYHDAKTFRKHAKKLGLMDDFRSGIPRTAYRGIVPCFIKGRRIYLVPAFKWTHYDPKWS